MNLLQNGLDWLERQRQQYLSVPIVYRYQDGTELQLQATIGKTIFRLDNGYGMATRIESKDFLITADAIAILPERGDEIIHENCRYEVLSPGDEPCFRYSDPYRKTLRIHTKFSGEQNAQRE